MTLSKLRTILTFAAASIACGCSSMTPGGDAGQLIQLTKSLLGEKSRVTIEQAAATPYASIGFRLGDSNEIMLVLATNDNGVSLWTSASRIALMTRNGRIVQTSGLGHDLGGLQMPNSAEAATAPSFSYLADYPDLGLYSVRISCHREFGPREDLDILGATIKTKIVRESCEAEDSRLDWSFRNTYWSDPDAGVVWRSIQHVHPNLDPIEIEVLREPG